jgi:hypothetical protein
MFKKIVLSVAVALSAVQFCDAMQIESRVGDIDDIPMINFQLLRTSRLQ